MVGGGGDAVWRGGREGASSKVIYNNMRRSRKFFDISTTLTTSPCSRKKLDRGARCIFLRVCAVRILALRGWFLGFTANATTTTTATVAGRRWRSVEWAVGVAAMRRVDGGRFACTRRRCSDDLWVKSILQSHGQGGTKPLCVCVRCALCGRDEIGVAVALRFAFRMTHSRATQAYASDANQKPMNYILIIHKKNCSYSDQNIIFILTFTFILRQLLKI